MPLRLLPSLWQLLRMVPTRRSWKLHWGVSGAALSNRSLGRSQDVKSFSLVSHIWQDGLTVRRWMPRESLQTLKEKPLAHCIRAAQQLRPSESAWLSSAECSTAFCGIAIRDLCASGQASSREQFLRRSPGPTLSPGTRTQNTMAGHSCSPSHAKQNAIASAALCRLPAS